MIVNMKTATSEQLFQVLTGQAGELAQLELQHVINLYTTYSLENKIKQHEELCLREIVDNYIQGKYDLVDAHDEKLVSRIFELLMNE